MGQNLHRFTTRRETCPLVTLNGLRIPQAEDAKYLGLYLDRILKKTCIQQAKATWNSIGQNVAARQQIATIDRK